MSSDHLLAPAQRLVIERAPATGPFHTRLTVDELRDDGRLFCF